MPVKRKRSKLNGLGVLGLLVAVLAISYAWFRSQLAPTDASSSFYVRFARPVSLGDALTRLQGLKIVRNNSALRIYAFFHGAAGTVRTGTYVFQGGLTDDQILSRLNDAIHNKFRFPETNWARRNANLLQRADIANAKEYLALVNNPAQLQNDVSFPLPSKSLEGYLLPDTYDLAPLTGARTVVDRQLRAFQNKVVKTLGPEAAASDVICKASLVELETGTDRDRAMIAGVIENRLKKGIPLQIDAGLEYALGKWRRLYFKDYKSIKSPYNLYLHKGLPPTPICSPSFKSIVAALHPAKHDYLYYVAMPDGHSIYAKTPAEHEHNIRLRKLALAARAKQKALLRDFLNPSHSSSDSTKGKA